MRYPVCVPRSGCQQGLSRRLSWARRCHLPAVSSRSSPSVPVCVLISYKDTDWNRGPW